MKYRDEIKKILDTIEQENILRFIYSLLKVAADNPDQYEDLLRNAID